MNINNKIISLLIFSFFLISTIITYNSIHTLKINQNDNLLLFKKEFSELGIELFNINSDLFFNALIINKDTKNPVQDVSDYIVKTNTDKSNIVVVSISNKKIVDEYNKSEINSLFDKSIIDGYLTQNILNQKTDFDFDNFKEFESDTTNTIILSKIHYRIYRDAGIMVGFGQKFTTGKIRIDFIERQNKALYNSHLQLSIAVALISLIIIIILVALIIKKVVIKPLNEIITVSKLITEGDLSRRVEVKAKDEIGQLGLSFNEMTEKLQNIYLEMDKNVKLKTEELSIKSKAIENQNIAIINILKEKDESKE